MANKEKKSRKTIHQNPAITIIDGIIERHNDKEAAEKHMSENLLADETGVVYLLYKEYVMEKVTTTKLKAKK